MRVTLPNYKEHYFPNPDLTQVEGPPSFMDIHRLRKEILENLASYPSERGGGEFGHMGVGLSAEAYREICNTPWTPPAKPTAVIVPTGASDEDSRSLKETYKEDLQEYNDYIGIIRTVKNQLKQALDHKILLPLCNTTTGALEGTIPELFQYLFASYGNITAVSLSAKLKPTSTFIATQLRTCFK